MSRLTRLLAPRSIAVVGATDREGTYAHTTLLNLARAAFAGQVIGVHPTRTFAAGVRCVPTLADAGPVDAVVIATPADSAPGYVAQAADLGCGGAVVYAAGFAEAGRLDLQARLVQAAGAMPVIGPNGNGFVTMRARAPLWGDAVTLADRPGNVVLISESGNIGVVGMAHRGGEGLHTVVSTGNAAVVGSAEILEHMATVEDVRAVALYLEADGDGPAWCRALAACAERDVRVVVLKAGRSDRGAAVGAAHTAAMVGDQGVFRAMIHEAGGVMVTQPLQLLETARALATGRRDDRGIAIMTCSGGDAAIAADLAADVGARLADLGEHTEAELRRLLPPAATVANPLDHTALVWADTEAIAALAEALGGDDAVGHLVYVQDEPPGLPPGPLAEWRATRLGGVVGGQRAGLDALVVATTPGQAAPGAIAGLDSALTALAALQRRGPDAARLRDMATAVHLVAPGPAWPEDRAKALLSRYGVPTPRGEVVDDAATACDVARRLGTPVVLKVIAPGLLHKSDIGGVVLDACTDDAIAAAAEGLLGLLPGARVLVESRASGGVEVLVSARRDGVVPTLTVGLGGVWTEALRDLAVIPLPADSARIRQAVMGLRASALLEGARGGEGVDVEGLCQAAAAIGHALVAERLHLIEVNPLIVNRAQPVAVDAVIR